MSFSYFSWRTWRTWRLCVKSFCAPAQKKSRRRRDLTNLIENAYFFSFWNIITYPQTPFFFFLLI